MSALLEVEGLEAGYADTRVLFGVELAVARGAVATLIGRNGMGKTTTIKAVTGLVRPRAGRVRFDGQDMTGRPPFAIARAGLGLVPEGRQIFPTLSVEENLVATAANRRARRPAWNIERVWSAFPRLAERRRNMGSQLSGGEQQMLAVARALMTNPELLVLDEATEGLAPLIRAEIWDCLAALKAQGQAILVVDKNLDALLALADRHYVLEKGRVVWTGSSAELAAEPDIVGRHIAV